ncbi:MAG: hypothetical protein AAGI23_02105 [Bacteroidota bacterium]
MRKVIFLLTSIVMMGSLQAQSTLYPKRVFDIQREGQIYMTLEIPSFGFKRFTYDWKVLLIDFQENLQSIQSEVPTYNIYNINYDKGVSMRIEDVNDIVKYKVEDNRTTTATRQSKAILREGEFSMTLYFSQLDDLFSDEYRYMIIDAMAKWNKTIKIWRTDFTYSYTEGKMVKGYEPDPLGKRITFVVGPSIGVYKNRPIYELVTGVGATFGRERQNLFYLFTSQVYQYQEEAELFDNLDYLVGMAYSNSTFGAHLAIPVDNRFREEYYLRYGISFYPVKGLTLNAHFFLPKENGTLYGFSVGYGF